MSVMNQPYPAHFIPDYPTTYSLNGMKDANIKVLTKKERSLFSFNKKSSSNLYQIWFLIFAYHLGTASIS